MILSQRSMVGHGPFISFADMPRDAVELGESYVKSERHRPYAFFDFADDLLGSLCSLCRTQAFFPVYGDTQFRTSWEIRGLSAGFLDWARQICVMTDNHFDPARYGFQDIYSSIAEAPRFRSDLLETLSFLACRINQVATAERVLLISGI